MTLAVDDPWLERYRQMADRMYEVRRHARHLGILGISTLHPRYPIPQDHLDLMKLLLDLEKAPAAVRPPAGAEIFVRWLQSLLYACRESLYLFVLRIRFGRVLQRLAKEPVDLLVKSWCFGSAGSNGAGDFYYGTLGQLLQKKGVRSLFLLGDARGRMSATLIRQLLKGTHLAVVPEPLLLPPSTPFLAAWRQLRGAFAIRRLITKTRDPQLAAVCRCACFQGVQPAALRHGLYFDIALHAVARWKPKALVTLYEGQPWEKLAWHGAKAARPECRIVGYQHTVIMPHALSLLAPNRPSWEMSVPEAVLCLGETTRRMLSAGHEPFGTRLFSFGSFRHENGLSPRRRPQPGVRTTLVLPVGVLNEAVVLFHSALELARAMPAQRFLFRCHPVLPFEEVRPHLGEDPKRYSNVEVSREKEAVRDFTRSSSVLYHGSSAVLYAVLHGLKPLYWVTPQLPDTDPLFELQDWRVRVGGGQEAAQILTDYAALSEEEAHRQWFPARSYVEDYTKPVDDRSVEALLEAAGVRGGVG